MSNDDRILTDAVAAFAAEVEAAGLTGLPFSELHDHFDPNQAIDDLLTHELETRGLPHRSGDDWLTLVNAAAGRYDERYATAPATTAVNVLIHLNVTLNVVGGDDLDAATFLATTEYLQRHGIPVDDLALIDVL